MEAKQVIIYEGTVWGDLLSSDIVPGDTAFMAVCTALVFFMTPGLGNVDSQAIFAPAASSTNASQSIMSI